MSYVLSDRCKVSGTFVLMVYLLKVPQIENLRNNTYKSFSFRYKNIKELIKGMYDRK